MAPADTFAQHGAIEPAVQETVRPQGTDPTYAPPPHVRCQTAGDQAPDLEMDRAVPQTLQSPEQERAVMEIGHLLEGWAERIRQFEIIAADQGAECRQAAIKLRSGWRDTHVQWQKLHQLQGADTFGLTYEKFRRSFADLVALWDDVGSNPR